MTVYANVTEKIGEASPPLGFADIALLRPLKLGQITATQTVKSLTSDQSLIPVEQPDSRGNEERGIAGAKANEIEGTDAPQDHL